jgi:hypothetical protein
MPPRLMPLAVIFLALAPAREPGPPADVAVTIEGAADVPEHRLARLSLAGAAVDSAAWTVFPFGVADGVASDGGRAYAFTGPPGRYDVLAYGLAGGKLVQAQATVTIGGAAPGPVPPPQPTPQPPAPNPPGPTPQPPPTPSPQSDAVPMSTPLSVVALIDARNPAPDVARLLWKMLPAQDGGKALSALNARFSVADVGGADDLAAARWKALLADPANRPPLLVVEGPDGKVYGTAALPSSASGVVMAVRQVRGL